MALHSWNLQKAIYSKLNDATISGASISDVPVYDDVPEGTSAPYINIGEETAINDGTKTVDAVEHTLTIHIWSEYRGRYEIKHIMEQVYQNLHNTAISVSGASLVNTRQEFSTCLLYTSPSPRDRTRSRMPSSA